MLASDPSDPAFAPEPILLEDLQRWSSSIVGELGVTLAKAAERFPGLAERQDALTGAGEGAGLARPVGAEDPRCTGTSTSGRRSGRGPTGW